MLSHVLEQVLDTTRKTIPVMSPQLPSADRLLPYLRRIDASRTYTNFGPLVLELEARLAARLAPPLGGLVTASSGTAALVGAVLAAAGRASHERPFALMPAYTFVATAVAAEQCGYRPYFADIDTDTWMLAPDRLINHPMLDRIGVVIPVAPYGMGVRQAPWLEFRDRTGIAVVIDGAASFEAADANPGGMLGSIPVTMSFHATKSFACGEGGAVLCSDLDLVRRTAQALNFGFHYSRQSGCASTNGKMSEYHAAIGLAELDQWERKWADFAEVANTYRECFDAHRLGHRLRLAPQVCSSYALLVCDDAVQAQRVQQQLSAADVEYRLWYGDGLRGHPHFAGAPADPLDVTERVAPCIIGLPVAPDLSAASIARVAESVARELAP